MARKIELSFYDKKYVIEFNRNSVKYVLQHTKGDGIEQAIVLIKGGLLMHHENDMPTDDDVLGWVLALGDDIGEFAKTLQEMVADVMKTFENDRKNLKWGKVA